MKAEVHTTLENIGLSKGEIAVYLAMLETGITSTGDIVKKAKISSSKIYQILERLIEKGLANYIIEHGIRQYSATPVERLMDFMDDKKKSIEDGKDALREMIPILKAKQNEQKKTDTLLYRGRAGPIIVLKECLDAGRRGEEVLAYGTTDQDDYDKNFPAQTADFVAEHKKIGFKNRLLYAKGCTFNNPSSEIRYLPKGIVIPIRTVIYGSKVAIIDFTEPYTTIIIDKKSVCEGYKTQFELLWKMSTKK